jgi:transcriptional regulator with XRE-family HTH domain
VNLGHNIRTARQARQLTQAQLGKLVDRSRLTVNAWENGRSHPRTVDIKQIAKVLHTTEAALFQRQSANH